MQLLMGGSFDPVHCGHVAVAGFFVKLLAPDLLRLIPAGDPWQRAPLIASAAHRVRMLELAFANQAVPVQIDQQEIERKSGSYTVDTLRSLRSELGAEVSLAWIIGADQLQGLQTWRDWRELFGLAHFCIAARPGYSLEQAALNPEVAREIKRRLAPGAHLHDSAAGLVCMAPNLSHDLSSTAIRAAFARGEPPSGLLPPAVLDYALQHHLYRT